MYELLIKTMDDKLTDRELYHTKTMHKDLNINVLIISLTVHYIPTTIGFLDYPKNYVVCEYFLTSE